MKEYVNTRSLNIGVHRDVASAGAAVTYSHFSVRETDRTGVVHALQTRQRHMRGADDA